MNWVPAPVARVVLYSSNLLDRKNPLSASSFSSTALQSQVDSLIGGFVQGATDWKFLSAMTAGGLAYRAGRIGVMGLGGGNAVRAASIGLGLSAEVSAFEVTNRGLSTLFRRGGPMWPPAIGSNNGHPHGGAPTNDLESNLWRWSGTGGFRQGLFQSLIAFGALKGAGRFSRGQNLIAQHLLQDTAMVLGHQVSGLLGILPRPTGNLAQQFLHAETMNWQMAAGLGLVHRLAPALAAGERALDLSLPPAVKRSVPNFLKIPDRLRPAVGVQGTSVDGFVWSMQSSEGGPPRPLFSSATVEGGATSPAPSRSFRMGRYQHVLTDNVSHVSAIREVIKKFVPPECRCLILHVMGKPRLDTNWTQGLLHSLSLAEIQILFVDGNVYRLNRNLSGVTTVKKTTDPERFGVASFPEDQILRIRLLSSLDEWNPPKASEKVMDLPPYIRSLARATGQTNHLVRRLLNDPRLAKDEVQAHRGHLENLIEAKTADLLPFSLVSALAEACRTDPRKLVIASDRHYFPDWDPRLWESPILPLYLEREDLSVQEHFEKLGPVAKMRYLNSFAGLVFRERKNPFHYYNRQDLAGALGISPERVLAWELEKDLPTQAEAEGLAKSLYLPQGRIIASLKRAIPPENLPSWVLEFQGTEENASAPVVTLSGESVPSRQRKEKAPVTGSPNPVKAKRERKKLAGRDKMEAPPPHPDVLPPMSPPKAPLAGPGMPAPAAPKIPVTPPASSKASRPQPPAPAPAAAPKTPTNPVPPKAPTPLPPAPAPAAAPSSPPTRGTAPASPKAPGPSSAPPKASTPPGSASSQAPNTKPPEAPTPSTRPPAFKALGLKTAEVTSLGGGKMKIAHQGHEATIAWNPSENPVVTVRLGGKVRFVRKENDGSFSIE